MVEKTIHEDKVVTYSLVRRIIANVGSDEFSFVAASCVIYIRWVGIETQVVAVGKVARVSTGTAADIKDSSGCAEIIVLLHGSEFLFLE